MHERAPCGLRRDQDRRVRVRRGGRGVEEPEAQEDRSKKGAPASAAVRYVKGENHSLLLSLHMDIPGLGGRIPWSWKKGSFRRIEFVEMYFFFFLKIHSFSEYYFAPSNVFEKLDKKLDSADASRVPCGGLCHLKQICDQKYMPMSDFFGCACRPFFLQR